MSNDIVKHQPLTPDVWNMIQTIAPVMQQARLFGVATESQAAAIMLKGYELGLPFTASFDFVVVIQGKPGLIPRGALALIHNSPLYADMKIEDITDSKGAPSLCKVWMKRTNGFEYTAQFTMEDAKRANLIKPDSGWANYPANMMRWRAIGFCADVVFPDVLGGMKRADELGADLTPDGEVIQGSWTVQEKQPIKTIKRETTINDLMALFGAENILRANNGNIPSTPEQIKQTIAFLDNEQKEVDKITVEGVGEVEP